MVTISNSSVLSVGSQRKPVLNSWIISPLAVFRVSDAAKNGTLNSNHSSQLTEVHSPFSHVRCINQLSSTGIGLASRHSNISRPRSIPLSECVIFELDQQFHDRPGFTLTRSVLWEASVRWLSCDLFLWR